MQPLIILADLRLCEQRRLRQAIQNSSLFLSHNFSKSLALNKLSSFAVASFIAFLYFNLRRILFALISPLRGLPKLFQISVASMHCFYPGPSTTGTNVFDYHFFFGGYTSGSSLE